MWLLDLGNTRLKLACAEASAAARGIGPVTALVHEDTDFEARLLRVLAQAAPGAAGSVAWLASVAPEGVRRRVEAALGACGLTLKRVVTRPECAGLRIAYADPSRLGVDRFLALLAARARGGDQLVVSFGSALTVDLLDARGRHHGGLIGIAAGHARRALAERFPALDRGEGDATVAFAADTPDAVAAGTHRQALGLVLAAWDDACAALGRPPALLLGGGDAPDFADALARRLNAEVAMSDALVLEGLRVYAGSAAD
ncbi:MAG: type III pantothenate kinase [Silanimonas sp.]